MGDDTLLARLRSWAKGIKRDVVTLWLAARDPRVPRFAKLLAAMVTAYALSPVDLIPDFIPVLGYLDDLVIVPLGIAAAVRMIPPPIMADLRAQASQHRWPTSIAGLAAILCLWIAAAWFAAKLLGPSLAAWAERS